MNETMQCEGILRSFLINTTIKLGTMIKFTYDKRFKRLLENLECSYG